LKTIYLIHGQAMSKPT